MGSTTFKLKMLEPTLFLFGYDNYASDRMVASKLFYCCSTPWPLLILPFEIWSSFAAMRYENSPPGNHRVGA